MEGRRKFYALPASRRGKYVTVALWLIIVAVAGSMAGKLSGAENNEASSWLPGSAESTQVVKLAQRFRSDNVIPAVVVYERPSGVTAADRTKAAADTRAFGRLAGVQKVAGPIPSKDGKALETVVPADLGSDGWNNAGPFVDHLKSIADHGANGMSAHVTGPAGNAADSGKAFAGIDGKLLYATIGVVIALLLLTYRSPILWLLPVLSAGVALATSEGVVYLLAAHAGLTVNAQSAGILTVLVFGASTDYALLLVARYREELRRHEDRHEAMAVAMRRAGPAIVASGSTVILGLLCLLVAELNSTHGLGPVAAAGVAIGLLAMLTLLPALLVLCGRWIFWPTRPHFGSEEPAARGLWSWVGRAIARRPRTTWITTSVVLGALALGLFGLNAGGLTTEQSFRGTPPSVAGEQVLARHFPGGAGSPVVVIGKAPEAGALRSTMGRTDGIAAVSKPQVRGGLAYLQGTLTAAPDSEAAYRTVDRVRDAVHAVPGADAKVGGDSAVTLDTQRAATRDNKVIIPVVLIVVVVILGLLLRAILAPVLLVATVVLSFGAALGASSLVFHHLFGMPASDPSLPLYVFTFLVALGIDYNIFLMTRVREEALTDGTRRGAVTALAATGGVITSAGAVLAGTFAVLGTLPLTAFAQVGFAVAFGVLLDTIVVRSILVTALNLDIGRHMWWPSRLSRSSAVDPRRRTRPVPDPH